MDEYNNSGIYRITNKINNKCYVGCSINISSRYKQHISGKKKNILYHAFVKHGIENFKFEILHNCRREDFDYIEKFEIVNNDCIVPKGYNSTSGGYSGYYFDDISRQKMSTSQTGKKHSEETKRKMSEQRSGENNASFGKSKSESHKLNISNSLKGRFCGGANPCAKKVKYENTIYDSVTELARHLNMCPRLLRYYKRQGKIFYGDVL